MSDQDARAFIEALTKLERNADVEPLVELFAEDSTCQNLAGADAMAGPEGARRFWTADRSLFDSVQSEFHNVISSGDASALEWTRTGTGRGGAEVKIGGVSILEFVDGKVTRFTGYLDPAALGRQGLDGSDGHPD